MLYIIELYNKMESFLYYFEKNIYLFVEDYIFCFEERKEFVFFVNLVFSFVYEKIIEVCGGRCLDSFEIF